MRLRLLGRQGALAAVALAAAASVVALGADGDGALEAAPTPAGGRWQQAVAAVYPEDAYGRRTPCDVELTRETIGVAHPVLPCGVDLVLSYGGRELRVEVVDQGPSEPGREFHLTEAVARALGFTGEGEIRWRFAG